MNRSNRLLAALIMLSMSALAACGGGGDSGSPLPPGPTQSPTPTPPPPNVATCPSSGSSPTSVGMAFTQQSVGRRAIPAPPSHSDEIPDVLVVMYSPGVAAQTIPDAASRLRARPIADMDFRAIGVRAKTIAVDPSTAAAVMSQLKATAGVLSVQHAQYRHAFAAPPDDPRYVPVGAPPPYFETSTIPGQWDMHVLNLDTAWASFPSTSVAGATIAVVDTGVDVTQTELTGGKIIRTRCFVTFPAGTAQTTGTFVTDTDGHGTDVAGIADDDTNNNFEFAGVGWNAPLMAYRVFPTEPSPPCDDPSQKNNPQCSASDVDVVSAINDAVANGAKVINLSLGSTPPCNDTLENTAVEAAISQGIVVVAAAGNESAANLDCPAADPGVIAVGASALNDSITPAKEVVASYSNYLTTNGGGNYMVAPGGDSTGDSSTVDFLHWIINLYSSTGAPIMGKAPMCGTDCTALFTGTSQATPHVVGIVSLMLAASKSGTLTPARIASDLCSTADNIADSKQGCGRVNAGKAVALAATQ